MTLVIIESIIKMNRRAELAGTKMGQSIYEMVHLMYQNRTAIWFLWGLLTVIVAAFEKRHKAYCKKFGKEVIPKDDITRLRWELK